MHVIKKNAKNGLVSKFVVEDEVIFRFLTFRFQGTSVLVLNRVYSTSWDSASKKWAFSFSVESTWHPDTPNPGNERSRFQSRVLDTAAVIAINRTDSATGILSSLYNSDDNQHIQAPAQRVLIKAHRTSVPRSGAATYPATDSRPPTSLDPSGPIARTIWTHALRRVHTLHENTLLRIIARSTYHTPSTHLCTCTHHTLIFVNTFIIL